ncbi:hypothetical protein SAMD00019534_097860 [Acytostelium subglobosum LB1]|uniref:hypothetical protein n=1 Tax=Acytostelium subglobosum LB1 TaxID=1410327 RepID=UPI00064503C9|nr:hypothetical protein SAMD00019534_097860 [Acytostelium subglobosum LB1]GAM26611.1 hypothetical protein SAMD00019534_097860 [Acytostelium subglobosum LB1]|eukprot:XP_012750272.1 hypothetical protein SAMD00019534_097860 [Acytostelium subglobosum LB1]
MRKKQQTTTKSKDKSSSTVTATTISTEPVNQYDNKTNECRIAGLGLFNVLEDDFLLEAVFQMLSVNDLLTLQAISKAFYILLNDDRLWMDVFIDEIKDSKQPLVYIGGSWKTTAMIHLYANGRDPSTLRRSFIHCPEFQSIQIYTRWLRRHMDVKDYFVDSKLVERRRTDEMTYQEFVDRYEQPSIPVLLTHGQTEWSANTNWAKDKLVETYGDITFKISHNDHKNIPMKLKDYANYMSTQLDEEPLYVFDQSFGEKAPNMLKDYAVHDKFFPEDLFQYQGEKRPHYRWIVIGPPRSGAPWHIDPAGTSAWNSLVSGRKRWLMYPPSINPIGVELEDIVEKFYGSPGSLLWLLEVYPYLPPDQRPIECIQNPGETIFVPGGWWHMVLNLEESIAVTQNFCDSQNFDRVCTDLAHGRESDYHSFKEALLKEKPEYEPKFKAFELADSQLKVKFTDDTHWNPMVKRVIGHHIPELNESEMVITTSETGQSPVFIVNSKYVIKFFSSKYGGEKCFKHEVYMYEQIKTHKQLSPLFPEVLAHGHLTHLTQSPDKADGDNVWPWPYMITSFIDATSLIDVQEVPDSLPFPYPPKEGEEEDDGELTIIDDSVLIPLLVNTASNIHTLSIPKENNPFLTDLNDPWLHWRNHITTELVGKFKENQWNWGGLPNQLLSQMESYLPQDINGYIDTTLPPCFIHGDLTDENILGDVIIEEKQKKKKQNKVNHQKKTKKGAVPSDEEDEDDDNEIDVWRASKFIDLGDANYGDRYYELVSLHLSIFAGNKRKLRSFLNSYRLPNNQTWLEVYKSNPQRFIYRCTCYTLVHHCNALSTIVCWRPALLDVTTIEELGRQLYDLDLE